MMHDMMDTKAAAKYLRVSTSTLNQYRVSGRGPIFHKLGPSFVRYKKADLDAWALSSRRLSTSDGGKPSEMTQAEKDEWNAASLEHYQKMNPIEEKQKRNEQTVRDIEIHNSQFIDRDIVEAFGEVELSATPFEFKEPTYEPSKNLMKAASLVDGPLDVSGVFLKSIWERDLKPELESRGLEAGVKAGPRGFRFDDDLGYLDIYWGGYEYSIAVDRIVTQENLIGLLFHICEKEWTGYNAFNALALIDACASKFRWRKYL